MNSNKDCPASTQVYAEASKSHEMEPRLLDSAANFRSNLLAPLSQLHELSRCFSRIQVTYLGLF
jgi:hypothetical protein